jgi:photosystem II stability/assembly factor-like uncharacterized protein
MLAGVLFVSRSNFWAAVSDERSGGRASADLLHTTNGGKTWTDVRSFPHDGGTVWIDFLNRRRGWVMVDQGAAMDQDPVTIYRTDSGGARWAELARSSGPMWTGTRGAPSSYCDKTGISFSNASSGWITGFCNGLEVVDHTLDGGVHWRSLPLTHPQATEYGGDTLPPRFSTSQDGAFAATFGARRGYRNVIYTTTNAGISWTAHAVPAGPPGEEVDIVSPAVWILASGHTLYTTTNAGAGWRSLRSAISGIVGWSGTLDFVTPTDGWAVTNVGPPSQLWHTTTGGRNWTRIR